MTLTNEEVRRLANLRYAMTAPPAHRGVVAALRAMTIKEFAVWNEKNIFDKFRDIEAWKQGGEVHRVADDYNI